MKPIVVCVLLLALGMGQPEHEGAAPLALEDFVPGALVLDRDGSGVHNVRQLSTDRERSVLSGSLPDGRVGFETLANLGVTTVISVDAARPEYELAGELGMRTIHIPIKYSGITEEQRTALALALAQSEGTVYVHCHHGLHRGPAAAVIGLIGIGACTPEDGHRLMHNAGTSLSYMGLWDDVAGAVKLRETELAQAEPMMVEYARIEGLAATMAEIDRVYDHLAVLSKNNWQAPADHPDLSARSEAGQLHDLFRRILADKTLPVPDEKYAEYMTQSLRLSETLEAQILGAMNEQAVITMERLQATCSACHKTYR